MPALRRLLALRDDRPVFVAVSLLTLAALFAYPAIDWYLRLHGITPPFKFWDWGAYSAAVERWTGGQPIYVQTESDGYHGGYLYPPIALLAFAPFILTLPFAAGALAWQVCSVVLLWVGLQRLVSALGLSLHPLERVSLLPLLVGFHPLLLSIKLGQTAAALGALLTVAASASMRGRAYASGVLTACCGLVKLPYAPAGAHLLGNRNRFVGALTGGVGLLVISVLVFGVDPHRTYLDVLAWGIREGSAARSPRLWMPPYYRPMYGVPYDLVIRIAASCAIVVGVIRAAPRATRESTALGFAAVPLLAPLTYAYYFIAAVPAVVLLLAAELDREGGRPALPVVGLLLLHIHSPVLGAAANVAPAWIPGLYLQMGLWGNLLLVGLAGVRVASAGGANPFDSVAAAKER